MPEELSREILKLEARLEGFLKDGEEFVRALKSCLDGLKEVNNAIESFDKSGGSGRVKELTELRLEATKKLRDALEREGRVEHEKSHILESYGALILALEEQFQGFYSSS